jgi:hypothetical protein
LLTGPVENGNGLYNSKNMTERRFLVAALVVIALVVSHGTHLNEAPYLLEDRKSEREFLVRWNRAPWLAFEQSIQPTKWNISLPGFRLSKPGEWSLSVGDPIEAFDEYLGTPIHVEPTWPKDGTMTARYKCGKHGGLVVVRADCESRLVTKLAIYRCNIWSINIPPLPFASKEEREIPGNWLSHYGFEKPEDVPKQTK